MLNILSGASSAKYDGNKLFKKTVTGLLLVAGLGITTQTDLFAGELVAVANPATAVATTERATIDTPSSSALTDGVYLYGQSPERDQIGSAYMIFAVQQGQVEGAFYMPRSSFDCFYGSMQPNQLALTVRDSYAQDEYPYAIALEPEDSVATLGDETLAPFGLQGFYPIEEVTDNDLRILSTCQSEPH